MPVFEPGQRVVVDLLVTEDRRAGAVTGERAGRVSIRLDEPAPPYGGRDVNVPVAQARLDERDSL